MYNKYVLFGSLTVSWLGTAANWASDAKSIVGALSALASLVASCYAIAIARQKLKEGLEASGDGVVAAKIKREGRKERKGRNWKNRGANDSSPRRLQARHK